VGVVHGYGCCVCVCVCACALVEKTMSVGRVKMRVGGGCLGCVGAELWCV